MFRVEQITVTEENTVLIGQMITGALDWRQRIELQIEEDMKTVFTAPLRGMVSMEDTGLTLFDPSMWEKIFALPLLLNRDKRIGLILDGKRLFSPLTCLPGAESISVCRCANILTGSAAGECSFLRLGVYCSGSSRPVVGENYLYGP